MTNNYRPIANTRILHLVGPGIILITTEPWGEYDPELDEDRATIVTPAPNFN